MRIATHNLILVGAVSVLARPVNTSPTTKDGCPSGLFPCYMDCCRKEWFCNKEPTEERCQPCEFQKEWCGTDQMDKDCDLYCHKLAEANSALTPKTTIPPAAESSNDGPLPHGLAVAIIAIAVILTIALFAMLWWLLRHRRNGTRPDFIKTFCCQKKRRIVKEGSNRSTSGSTVTEGGSVNSTDAVEMHSLLTQAVASQGKPEITKNEERISLLGITPHSSNESVSKMGAAQEVSPAYASQTTTKKVEAVPVKREAPINPSPLAGGRITPPGQRECVCQSATSGDIRQNVHISLCGHHGGCQGTASSIGDVQQSNLPRRIPTAHPAAAGQMNHDGSPLATDQADCPPRSNDFTPNQHSAFSASASRQDIHVNHTAGATATTASSVNATPTIAHDAAGAVCPACSRSTNTNHVCRDPRLITNPTPSSEGEDHSIAIDHVKPTQPYMRHNPHMQQEIGDHHTNWPS